MNIVAISGRLTKDVDYRTTNNMTISRFSVAVQRRTKNESGQYDADFISCVAFNKTADFIAKFFNKGMKINIQGHLQSGSYINQQGVKVYTLDTIVDSAEFAESKNSYENNNVKNQTDDGFTNLPDIEEELPFN